VLPGSRIRYALLVAGEPEPLQRFRASLSLQRGEELESIDDARPEVNRALERAEQFLSLAGLTSVIVAGIAIALSARRFSQRHMDTCAIMRTFGATQRQIIALFGLEILVLGLVSSVAGGILGYGAHLVIVKLMGGAVGGTLAPPSLAPFHVAWLTGVITISGFALPPLVGLWTVPPLRVLRRDVTPRIRGHYLLYVAALGAVALLAPWGSGSRAVTLYTLGGSAAACATLALAAYLLVILLRRVRHGVGAAWRYGMASIARHAGGSVLQTTAIGLGVMILLLLAVVRNDLLDEWRGTLAPDAPNHFLINVQPGDVEPLRAFLGSRGVTVPDIYPMVRGRLVRINDRDVSPDDYFNPEARRLVDREFNLSMTEQPAADNRIVEGRWWTDAGAAPDQLSMEQGIAMQLGLKLGDRLSFQIADSTISASITSIRTVDWDSFNVNFFVIGAPGLFDRQPATYITSFFLSQADREWLPDLVNRFPSVTLIDVDAIMRQVRAIMDRVTMAIEFVFGFTVIAGLMVLWAAIQSTQDERRYDAAIFKSVGASHTTLRAAAIAELATLGLLAGGIAAAAAAIAGGVFASQVFEIRYVPDVALLLAGVIACALFVVTGGYLALRHALRQPPITLLRQGI
jgi:putative ABC transport system permease protein